MGIFLSVLIEEIDAGNRQGGHFTKLGWSNIVQKFNNASGCSFSIAQLKNKLDNMKKEYSIWEKLRMDESGLGYDRSTNRITAPAAWWRHKMEERPEYKRFRTHGPLHLEMQEKVFRGIVATGYMEYHPPSDTPPDTSNADDDSIRETQIENESSQTVGEGGEGNNEGDQPAATAAPKKVNGRKRRRTRSQANGVTAAEVNASMLEYLKSKTVDSTATSPKYDGVDTAMSYTEAIKLFKSQSWIQIPGKYFSNGVKLLGDRTNRIAFAELIELGEQVIKDWIDALMN